MRRSFAREASPWLHHDLPAKDWLAFCQRVRTPHARLLTAITDAERVEPSNRQHRDRRRRLRRPLYSPRPGLPARHPPTLLIEPQGRFLFLPLLYELLSGELRSWEIAPRYDELLAGRGVAWLQDRVERIDAHEHEIHTHGGRTIRYSRLVMATGGAANTFGVPGADQHTLGFRSLADVERLQQLVGNLRADRHPLQRIAIVGAGPTGVELACKLADIVGDCAVIELIEQGGTHLPQAKAFNREQALIAVQSEGCPPAHPYPGDGGHPGRPPSCATPRQGPGPGVTNFFPPAA